MQEVSKYRIVVWTAGVIGAGVGLVGAWTIRPTFLMMPIRSDSIFYSVPADAPWLLQATSFIGMALIALLHFTMWVGGSAGLAAFTVAYIGSLVCDSR